MSALFVMHDVFLTGLGFWRCPRRKLYAVKMPIASRIIVDSEDEAYSDTGDDESMLSKPQRWSNKEHHKVMAELKKIKESVDEIITVNKDMKYH